MQIDTEQALTSLLDVAGVEGSFLVNSAGALAAWNMPAVVEEDVLESSRVRTSTWRRCAWPCG